MPVVGCVCVCGISGRNSFKGGGGGECETSRKSNFLKKCKMVILVKKSRIFLDLG